MLALQYIGDVESSAMFGLIVSVDRSETVGKIFLVYFFPVFPGRRTWMVKILNTQIS